LAAALIVAVAAVSPATSAGRPSRNPEEDFGKAVVQTDGHLRPGHLETIWVRGFPGRGRTEVAFFPTAICEAECAGLGGKGGHTNDKGIGRFRVRVPNGFINSHRKFTPFRDYERIELSVQWYGPKEDEFDVATAKPPPVIVRVHGAKP
jgi:hypothetical protein